MKTLIVSSANMDLDFYMRRVPRAGETVAEIGRFCTVPGGKGANAAVATARLGGQSVFCTCLGDDENGRALLRHYNACGIDTRFITLDGEKPTGVAAILIEEDGSNRIIVYPGANRAISEEQIDRALDGGADALFLQLEIAWDTVCYAAHGAAGRQIPIVLDAGPADRALLLEALPPLCIFSPNETETEIFTGIAPTDDASCRAACEALLHRVTAQYLVLKLGGRGAYLFDGTQGMCVPTYPGEVVDTTAAGDAFTAALTQYYFTHGDMYRAVRYANAVGTLTVRRKGAGDAVPTADEVARFCAAHGIG